MGVLNIQIGSSATVEDKIESQRGNSKFKWTYHHATVYVLTFVSYALMHASRKTFTNVKHSMVAVWIPKNMINGTDVNQNSTYFFDNVDQAERFLGALDAIFEFTYSIGLFICGMMGDRFEPRLVLCIGMFGTGITSLLFGYVTETFKFYSKTVYVILWLLNGFVQSCGWPAEVAIVANWFDNSKRGMILGLWAACASIGNILGSFLNSLVLTYGYEYAFLLTSSLLMAFGVVVYFGLISSPKDIGLQQGNNCNDNNSTKSTPLSFWPSLMLPGVIAYSLAYAGLKSVNYSIFFWLPYYLTKALGWSEITATKVSTWYDWGGIPGGLLAGILSDRLGKRTPVIVVQLIMLTVALFIYTHSPNNVIENGLLLAFSGFFGMGAQNLISAVCSADLGSQAALINNGIALSTVTGIVDGTGSLGASFAQILIPYVSQWFDWTAVFYMFMIFAVLTILCLARLCWRETWQLFS